MRCRFTSRAVFTDISVRNKSLNNCRRIFRILFPGVLVYSNLIIMLQDWSRSLTQSTLMEGNYIHCMHVYKVFKLQFPVAASLRCRSTAARLLRSWVRIPPGTWMFVCCMCCVLSGRGLCDELITCPQESYWLCRVVVCDHEASGTRRP
jgi:hypothetical protein